MGIAMILLVYAGWQIKARLDAANVFAAAQMAALMDTVEESQHGVKVVKDRKAAPAQPIATPAVQSVARPPQRADMMPEPGVLEI